MQIVRFHRTVTKWEKSIKQANKVSRKLQYILFISNTFLGICISYSEKVYSHLSNKRDVTLTDFEKFHPTQIKNPPYTFIDFLDFSTLHSTFIRFMYQFFPKNPASTFIPASTFSDLATFAPPSRLFQPPSLLER